MEEGREKEESGRVQKNEGMVKGSASDEKPTLHSKIQTYNRGTSKRR